MKSGVFDIRSEFFKRHYDGGHSYSRYISTGTESQRARWQDYEQRIHLTDAQKKLLSTFTRRMHVLVMSGIWCGDCMRQGAMWRAIEEHCAAAEFRYVDNQEHQDLRDELRIQGGARVPVIVTLSEDFFEVGRFGDRTLTAYRRKARTELGPACDSGHAKPDDRELAGELQDWIDYFERMQLTLRLSPFLRERHKD
jgi:hypothetical protein